jgi:hypothetical protein
VSFRLECTVAQHAIEVFNEYRIVSAQQDFIFHINKMSKFDAIVQTINGDIFVFTHRNSQAWGVEKCPIRWGIFPRFQSDSLLSISLTVFALFMV